jgi:hypothetical protein
MNHMHNNSLRSMVMSAAMTALALLLPMAFHAAGLGSYFLPMLLPLLLNGFLSSLPWAMLAGAVAPWVSALLTGMPPIYPPVALIMSIEGIVLAGTASLLFRLLNRRIWPALLGAITADRVVAFLLTWAMAGRFGISPKIAAFGTFVGALPGVALQIAVVPLVLRALRTRTSILMDAEIHG